MTIPKSALFKDGVDTWTVHVLESDDILICQHIEPWKDTKAIYLDKGAAEYVWRHLSEYLGKDV